MDIFSKTRIMVRLVWILGALNLILLAFFIWMNWVRRPDPSHGRPVPAKDLSAILKDELGLSATQTDQLTKIRADFFSKEKLISEQTRQKRDSMNMLMFGRDADETQLKQLAEGVSANEYEMELMRIEQARQVRTLLAEEQLNKLNKLVREVRDYLRPADK